MAVRLDFFPFLPEHKCHANEIFSSHTDLMAGISHGTAQI